MTLEERIKSIIETVKGDITWETTDEEVDELVCDAIEDAIIYSLDCKDIVSEDIDYALDCWKELGGGEVPTAVEQLAGAALDMQRDYMVNECIGYRDACLEEECSVFSSDYASIEWEDGHETLHLEVSSRYEMFGSTALFSKANGETLDINVHEYSPIINKYGINLYGNEDDMDTFMKIAEWVSS